VLVLTWRPAAGSKALRRRYKFKRRKQRDDAIAAALAEASAHADADRARAQHSTMLEALFELLFRVLKHAASSAALRGADAGGNGIVVRDVSTARMAEKCPLLYAALEGLGKFTHLISLEYFTDVLEVFQQLLSCFALPMRLRLRCLLTVSEIMRAQGDALNVDRRGFLTHLHEALALFPLQPLLPERDEDGGDDDDVGDGFGLAAADTGAVRVPI
jgi:nucleolar complex protein 3